MKIDAAFSVDFVHRLRFCDNAFDPAAAVLRDVVAAGGQLPARMLAFVDQGVLDAWPDLPRQMLAYAAAHADAIEWRGDITTIPGGEPCKCDDAAFQRVCRTIHEAGLCRQSYVLVVGGGAVLDVVGFAAAVTHRGVRLIRVPSTTLSQADSGVGVKNGINAFGKKNYLGTFTPPWAVLNDERLLTTLTDEDWRAGFAEAVKVGLVKDASLFAQIVPVTDKLRGRDMAAARPILRRSAQLHLEHIVGGGDPFELTAARPLDFGHWAAHKLEQLTGFTYPHGRAVSIGVALDATYSVLAGYLHESAADKILGTLHALGLPLFHGELRDVERLWTGLEDFREHLGGTLTITLLRDIGRALDVHRMDRALVEAAVARLGAKTAQLGGG